MWTCSLFTGTGWGEGGWHFSTSSSSRRVNNHRCAVIQFFKAPCLGLGFTTTLWITLTLIVNRHDPIEFFTIGVSIRLPDRSLQREDKKIRQKLPPVGIETRTSGSPGQCLTNWARQESVGQEISEMSFVCFMPHFTCWTLFISRIYRAWLYKGHEDSGRQLNVDLAQLVRHWPEDLEVLVSNPIGGIFWRIFFCSSLCNDLSDNLTETPIVKNSNVAILWVCACNESLLLFFRDTHWCGITRL